MVCLYPKFRLKFISSHSLAAENEVPWLKQNVIVLHGPVLRKLASVGSLRTATSTRHVLLHVAVQQQGGL